MKKQFLEFLGSADVQQFFEQAVLRPLLDNIFQYLYPYLLGVMLLWGVMFICIMLILVMIMRSAQVGIK
jgi:hypothetical protein